MAHPEPADSGRRLALIGPGRAGVTVASALTRVGWQLRGVAGRTANAPSVVRASVRFDVPVGDAGELAGLADLIVIATPDAAIATVAEAIAPTVRADALVIHLSGARGLDVLSVVPARVGALHPLQSLADPDHAEPSLSGSWAACAGDDAVADIARSIGLIPFAIADADRAAYHAAACIASNHLVALLAQVDASTAVPLAAFLPLVRTTIDNVAALGPMEALTGPVARGDVDTVRSHLSALPNGERSAYVALARRAATLAGRSEELAEVLG